MTIVSIANRPTDSLKPATHLAILYAGRGEFDRQRKSQSLHWAHQAKSSYKIAKCVAGLYLSLKAPFLRAPPPPPQRSLRQVKYITDWQT